MGTVSARKIMIAMDGSKYADMAFDWYVKYFYRESDFVVLTYCTEHGSLMSAPVPSSDPSMISKLANEEESDIKALLTSFQARITEAKQQHVNLKGSIQRVSGKRPGEAILAQANEQYVDMIITGSRGRGTLRRTVMGSVSSYIVHHSRVPVLVVRLDDSTQQPNA